MKIELKNVKIKMNRVPTFAVNFFAINPAKTTRNTRSKPSMR